MSAGTITLDFGGFQPVFGQIAADINGVNVPFSFNTGMLGTALHTFVLDSQMLAAANLSGTVSLNLNQSGVYDYVAYDFARPDASVVPEPATLILTGLGLVGVAARLRRRKNV